MGCTSQGKSAMHRAPAPSTFLVLTKVQIMPAHTLPEGYVWLGDAFDSAWAQIEGEPPATAPEPAEEFAAVVGGGKWNHVSSRQTDKDRIASRKRVEKLMRAALSSGDLRALVRDKSTGIPGEVYGRELWAKMSSFGFEGLLTEIDHLVSPGPKTDGQPVFVSKSELESFI